MTDFTLHCSLQRDGGVSPGISGLSLFLWGSPSKGAELPKLKDMLLFMCVVREGSLTKPQPAGPARALNEDPGRHFLWIFERTSIPRQKALALSTNHQADQRTQIVVPVQLHPPFVT